MGHVWQDVMLAIMDTYVKNVVVQDGMGLDVVQNVDIVVIHIIVIIQRDRAWLGALLVTRGVCVTHPARRDILDKTVHRNVLTHVMDVTIAMDCVILAVCLAGVGISAINVLIPQDQSKKTTGSLNSIVCLWLCAFRL